MKSPITTPPDRFGKIAHGYVGDGKDFLTVCVELLLDFEHLMCDDEREEIHRLYHQLLSSQNLDKWDRTHLDYLVHILREELATCNVERKTGWTPEHSYDQDGRAA